VAAPPHRSAPRNSSNDVDVDAADGEGAAAKKREDRRLGGLEALPWFLMSDVLDVVLLRIRDGRCVCACVCYVYPDPVLVAGTDSRKVLCMVILYSEHTRALTCENV
jgi:hypothetical protein